MSIYIFDVDKERADAMGDFISRKLNIDLTIRPIETRYKLSTGDFGTSETTGLHISYSLLYDKYGIYIDQMSGQCGVLIASNLSNNDMEVHIIEMVARLLAYRTMMVSHCRGSSKLAKYRHYESIWTCHNSHSDNTIEIVSRDVGNPTPDEQQFIRDQFGHCSLYFEED